MPTRTSFAYAFTLASFLALAIISANAQSVPPSSPVDVVYIASTAGIETYDVDPQTGIPTDEGLFVVPPENPTITPSSDGRFIYVIGNNPGSGKIQLWVYPTNSLGVPLNPQIETIIFRTYVSSFMIDPTGTLAYAVQSTHNSQGETLAGILLFHVNPATGMLSQTEAVATYPPNGDCTGILTSTLSLAGFNVSGSKLYDDWYCSDEGGSDVTYNTRSVNRQSGVLGPDVQTFYSSGTSEDSVHVNFTPNILLAFFVNGYGQGLNSIVVYPLYGGNKPILTCDATMLEACGYGLSETVNPSGNYIFIQIAPDVTQVTKLDLTAKQVVDTGYYLPDNVLNFSPDDRLIYTEVPNVNNPYTVPIYTFDAATGAVNNNPSAQISVANLFFTLVPALRK